MCVARCNPLQNFDEESARQHLLVQHGLSQHTAYEAATCTDTDKMWEILLELQQLPASYRYTVISEKAVLCTHCLMILESKHMLLLHIAGYHAHFRDAACMALRDLETQRERKMMEELDTEERISLLRIN